MPKGTLDLYRERLPLGNSIRIYCMISRHVIITKGTFGIFQSPGHDTHLPSSKPIRDMYVISITGLDISQF